jgi:hypothetical protein
MPFKLWRIYVAHAGDLNRERQRAAEEAESGGPTYAPGGYGPPTKDDLDVIPRRDS